jgi:lipopolysaccharide/colanic/teichoic acid biosynthesis glycosyltransferase
MKRRPYQALTILADLIILAASFLVMVWIKPASKAHYLPSHLDYFLILAGVWVIVSLVFGKLHRGKVVNIRTLLYRTIVSNLIAVSISILIMFMAEITGHSRMIVFGTIAVATTLEIICGICFLAIQKASFQDYQPLSDYKTIKELTEEEMVGAVSTTKVCDEASSEVDPELIEALIKQVGEETATGILNIARSKLNGSSRFVSTGTDFNIAALPLKKYSYLINLQRINHIKTLNSFLDTVNDKVKQGGYFLCCVETKDLRKKRFFRKYPPVINFIFYTLDFIVKRIFPKLRITKWLYLLFTRGNNMVISRAEALGRVSRAGFRIENESFINNILYIEGRKISKPLDVNGKNYGVLIALPRVGKDGQILKVYKLRTMHPYSEYIQDYVYSLFELKEGGKFKNDFRITSWGRFARKVWLDELPMLINLFRGNMKIVGIRPLSQQYFNLYSKELQEKRIRYKPGLVPPFYYDNPKELDEIMASEMKYLEAYEKKPIRTDIKYFFVSFWNILFRNARSQ